MEFHARQNEVCSKCSQAIPLGDKITWNRVNGEKFHPGCVPETTKTRTRSAGPKETLNKLIEELMGGINEENVRRIIQEELGNRNIVEVRTPDSVKLMDGVHERFEHLLYLISKRHHVYLWGPPGGGKSTAARQCAESLGWNYGYISLNPQTPDSRILGFIDATGSYRTTLFRKIYEDGGVFCIDELDNASASLLTTLNSALENGHGAFPDGLIKRHDNFVLVATGNTAGYGGNPAFPERRAFDSAFAERFTYLEWNYDENLERNIALSYNPDAMQWVVWVKQVRTWAKVNFPRLIASPRASFKLAQYSKDKIFTPQEMAENVVFRGIQKDVRDKVLAACPLPKV